MDKVIKIVFFFIIAIAVVVVLSGYYFGDLLTPQGGFFVSLDQGATWRRWGVLATGGNINRFDIIDVKHNPRDSRILYAATLNNGILKSVDGGGAWHKLEDKNNVLRPRADVQSIAIDPNLPDYKKKIPDRFYLAIFQDDYGRLLKTEDGGLSFKEVYIVSRPNIPVFAAEVDPKNPQVVWAGTGEGILLKSADYGESWKLAQEFGQAINYILVNPQNTNQMLVSTFTGGIFTSADGGATWIDESEGLNEFTNARQVESVAYNNSTGELYLASRFGLLRSADFGVNWRPLEVIFPNDVLPVLAVAFGSRGGQEMYVSASNLVYHTKDAGKSWQVRKLGPARRVRALWVDPKNDSRVMAGAGKAGRR